MKIMVFFVISLLLVAGALNSVVAEERLVIDRFTLVNAENGASIRVLNDGDTLNLAELPSRRLSILAEVSSEAVESVIFQLNRIKRFRHETAAPFALAGDADGKYRAWIPRVGKVTVIATPIGESEARKGKPLKLVLNVVDIKPALEEGEAEVNRIRPKKPEVPDVPQASKPLAVEVSNTQIEKAPEYGGERAASASLRLIERDLEVGECHGTFDADTQQATFDCRHYLRDVAEARLQVQGAEGKRAIHCSMELSDAEFVSKCPLTEKFSRHLKPGELHIQVLGGVDRALIASGQVVVQ